MVVGFAALSAYDDFSQPIMLSYDSEVSKFGIGSGYIGQNFYISTKTHGDSSVINFGRVNRIQSISKIDALLGVGFYANCEEHVCLDADTDEKIVFNLNVGFRYTLNKAALLIDLDSASRGIALGLAAKH